MRQWLLQRLLRLAESRPPNQVIGDPAEPYLQRWWVIPRNRLFNVYFHLFLKSDDPRALHDHPWVNFSYLLDGEYTEHTIRAGGIHHRDVLKAGQWRFRRSGKIAHRIELHAGPCWTLFITGPIYREWGFHCEIAGWRHWKLFTAHARDGHSGQIGQGCD